MSIKVMTRVWSHSRTSGAELLVMLALGDFSNDQGESYPSLRILAEKSRLTVRGVCKILDRLQAIGEIRRERSRGGKNRRTRYFIALSNSEHGSLNSIQRIANTECGDTQTVNSGSYALNRQGTVNKDTGAKVSEENQRKNSPPDDPEFERAWTLYPKRAGGNPKEKARAAWRARVREGVKPEEMTAGVERYATYVRAVDSEGTQYVKQAATFFGPEKHWRDDWTAPQNMRHRSAGGFVV